MLRSRSQFAIAGLLGLATALAGSAVNAQSPTAPQTPGASPSAVSSAAPSSTPFPWPTLPSLLEVPLPAPFEPSGPPAATATRHGVRMRMWLSSTKAVPGQWLQLLVRTTNLDKSTAWSHSGECKTSGTLADVDLRPAIPPGREQTGNAAAFKEEVLSHAMGASFTPWRYLPREGDTPVDGLVSGAWAECTTLPGPLRLKAGATLEERFAWYPAHSFDGDVWFQPLPPGTVPVTVEWPFIGRGERAPRHARLRPITVTASVELTGDGPGTPSLPELVDIALADPRFRAWVDDDPTRRTWDGASGIGWPGPTYGNNMLLRDLEDAPPTGIMTIELTRRETSRGVVSLDPWTGRVLQVEFLGN